MVLLPASAAVNGQYLKAQCMDFGVQWLKLLGWVYQTLDKAVRAHICTSNGCIARILEIRKKCNYVTAPVGPTVLIWLHAIAFFVYLYHIYVVGARKE